MWRALLLGLRAVRPAVAFRKPSQQRLELIHHPGGGQPARHARRDAFPDFGLAPVSSLGEHSVNSLCIPRRTSHATDVNVTFDVGEYFDQPCRRGSECHATDDLPDQVIIFFLLLEWIESHGLSPLF